MLPQLVTMANQVALNDALRYLEKGYRLYLVYNTTLKHRTAARIIAGHSGYCGYFASHVMMR
ncbi:hypothetical protein EBI00_00440 [Marinomonas hwangdonensis]|uniref:Uncharacterized protein n=1 Tax=Marinomonas hwangdonensis TaxID=1053647 RepID=A0A3M8Q963_9GAMM|nr:hypothetical protein [Marinomonas hwangdonensis]RNF52626.1 hypothetical protein EBI00_00440 [Marinomonas hwangdonensis]